MFCCGGILCEIVVCVNVKIHGLAEMEIWFWTIYLAVQPFCGSYDLTGPSTKVLTKEWSRFGLKMVLM